jgi:hypothetical protein
LRNNVNYCIGPQTSILKTVIIKIIMKKLAMKTCGAYGSGDATLRSRRMARDHCNKGLDDRCRDGAGEIRQKRGDTLVGTLRKSYGLDFAPGARSDMRLDTRRERNRGASLSKIIRGK